MPSESIFAYCHIGCVGGKSLVRYLRCSYGARHLDVAASNAKEYQAHELSADIRAAPFVKSISGHTLRPYVDYSEGPAQLRWYAILRDPIARMLSHFQQQVEHPSRSFQGYNLVEWLTRFHRANWQVKIIAGCEDTRLAFDMLANEFDAIGINERYEESLFLFRERMGLDIHFSANDPGPRPPENAVAKEKIVAQYHEAKQLVDEVFAPEVELYNRVKNELFCQQIVDYGGESKLKKDLKSYLLRARNPGRRGAKYYLNRVYSRAIHPISRRILS